MEHKQQTFRAEKIFTGSQWLTQKEILVSNGVITDIIPATKPGSESRLAGLILAPAFIDIQIYGADGQLLAVFPVADSLHKLYAYCTQGGASHFQPTVATNSMQIFYQCIDAVRDYWKEGGKGCIGLHIEGPWINPLKKGAHQESFIHSPQTEEVTALLEYGKGVITMITLAPEVCSSQVIELIQSYGVIISAGHSNATYDEAYKAFDSGIPVATHLFNAMSPLLHRKPGMVGAIFNHPAVMASIVPDGFHVDFSAIRIAKKIMNQRLFVITDAVTETTEGPYHHHLKDDKYESDGILSGSALTMATSLQNLVNKVGIELAEALRMVSLYPAQAINRANNLGKIEIGYSADFVLLNDSMEVIQLTSNGLPVYTAG